MKREEFDKQLIQIENNQFTENELEIPGEFGNNQTYEEIDLNADHIILLSQALKHNTYIKSVNLTGQRCGDIGAAALAEVTGLESLNLWCNAIGIAGATALAKSNLKILNLKENIIFLKEDNGVEMLEMIEAFIENKTITKLNLQRSEIPSEFIAHLIDKNMAITKLNVSKCYLSDEALYTIGNNKALCKLNISENNITDKAAEYICKNNSLKTLIVDKSTITDIGAKYFSFHPSLKKLSIGDSHITSERLGYLAYISNIDEIDISYKKQHISDSLMFQFYQTFNQIREERAKKNSTELNKNKTDLTENTENLSLIGNTDNPDDGT